MKLLLYFGLYLVTAVVLFLSMSNAVLSWRKSAVAIIVWHAAAIATLSVQWIMICSIAKAIHIPDLVHAIVATLILVVPITVTKLTDKYILK